ncbi:hypothetical protein IG631_02870 [Alternaria alternata]|nr:hypothetical protein IG631_02870 [Alternaria alternata]
MPRSAQLLRAMAWSCGQKRDASLGLRHWLRGGASTFYAPDSCDRSLEASLCRFPQHHPALLRCRQSPQ